MHILAFVLIKEKHNRIPKLRKKENKNQIKINKLTNKTKIMIFQVDLMTESVLNLPCNKLNNVFSKDNLMQSELKEIFSKHLHFLLTKIMAQ